MLLYYAFCTSDNKPILNSNFMFIPIYDTYENDGVSTSKQSPGELEQHVSVHIICHCDDTTLPQRRIRNV